VPSAVPGLLPSKALSAFACSTISIALCLLGLSAALGRFAALSGGLLLRGEGSLASCRNSTISWVLFRPRFRASRGSMPPELDVEGRGGTVLERFALSLSACVGDAGVGRGCSYLRSIGIGCASSSTGPSWGSGALGKGLSTDSGLDLDALLSLLNFDRGMAVDMGDCAAEPDLPFALERLLASEAMRAISLITVESSSRSSLSSRLLA